MITESHLPIIQRTTIRQEHICVANNAPKSIRVTHIDLVVGIVHEEIASHSFSLLLLAGADILCAYSQHISLCVTGDQTLPSQFHLSLCLPLSSSFQGPPFRPQGSTGI